MSFVYNILYETSHIPIYLARIFLLGAEHLHYYYYSSNVQQINYSTNKTKLRKERGEKEKRRREHILNNISLESY